MELDKKKLDMAVLAYYGHSGPIHSCVAEAIKTYLAETMRPGELVELPPPQPLRDYRKELWIKSNVSCVDLGAEDSIAFCNKVVEGFDKFFGEQK